MNPFTKYHQDIPVYYLFFQKINNYKHQKKMVKVKTYYLPKKCQSNAVFCFCVFFSENYPP